MTRTVSYTFETDGQKPWVYILNFDSKHHLIPQESAPIRDWTKLDFEKCSHCPLNSKDNPQCPVAKNLNEVVENFKSVISFTKYKVTIKTPERTYFKECSTQDGLKSLFGLIMATSACPHLDWLKPLARFHLPFADSEENLFRTLSLQLLRDFLDDENVDPKQVGPKIKERYKNVEIINRAFAKRIKHYAVQDADKNAISSLDVYVQMFQVHEKANFDALRKYFK